MNIDTVVTKLGHRNWIVIADSAFPDMVAPGIETVVGYDLETVFHAVTRKPHVRAEIILDAELDFLSEEDAPGVDAFRTRLAQLLEDEAPTRLPHAEILALMDEMGRTYRIVVIKTDLNVPYASVFLRLDCGYWSPESEAGLRARIERAAAAGSGEKGSA